MFALCAQLEDELGHRPWSGSFPPGSIVPTLQILLRSPRAPGFFAAVHQAQATICQIAQHATNCLQSLLPVHCRVDGAVKCHRLETVGFFGVF